MYACPTPLIANHRSSKIEDFFDAATLGTKFGDKTFTDQNDFDPARHYGKKIFAEEVEATFAKETELLKQRLSHLSPDAVARMVETAVPLINQFVARYHESLVRKFFASIQA